MARFDVEGEFAKCVKSLGGLFLDEVLVNPDFKNADFWFPDDCVVAELKCLTTDYFTKKDFRGFLSSRYSSWVQRGLVQPLQEQRQMIELSSLPVRCADEVIDNLKRKLESSSLKNANKQLRKTREYFNAEKAKGILLLVNDGNLALPPSMVKCLISRSINNQFRGINTVVHFSVNEHVSIPRLDMPTLFWMEWSFSDREKVDREFLDRLRHAWFAHYSALSGGCVYELIESDIGGSIDDMRFS